MSSISFNLLQCFFDSQQSDRIYQRSRQILRDGFIPALTSLVVISFTLVWLDRRETYSPSTSQDIQMLQGSVDRAIELQQLSTSLVRDREMMSLSVRASVATGDAQWTDRYKVYEETVVEEIEAISQSLQSVASASSVSPVSVSPASISPVSVSSSSISSNSVSSNSVQASLNAIANIDSLRSSILAATALEREALDYAQDNNYQRANEILTSEQYRSHQEIAAHRMQQLSDLAGQAFRLEAQYAEEVTASIASVRASEISVGEAGIGLLALAWLALLARINRDRYRRQKTEKRLQQSEELLMLCHEEVRVSKATLIQKNNTLEETLSELQQTKAALETSHQEVQVSRAALSQKADTLEKTVSELEATRSELAISHRAVQVSRAALAQKAATLEQTLDNLQQAQMQMIQSEKMSSLGQLVAGIAHEVNNPINFIYANLEPMREYTEDLLALAEAFQRHYNRSERDCSEGDCSEEDRFGCKAGTDDSAIAAAIEAADLAFVQADLPKIIDSMEVGTERIRQIVLSLQNFSRSDEEGRKSVDLHEGLESSLLIVQHRLKSQPNYDEIEVVREFGDLPPVECQPGLINQVFMNLLSNAIDSLEEQSDRRQDNMRGSITLHTSAIEQAGRKWVEIAVIDTGVGIPEAIAPHIFDAFFTTKPVGKGTGIGLSVSYTIVTRKHHGELTFSSTPGKGANFVVRLPVESIIPTEPLPLFTLQPPTKSVRVMGQAVEFVL